MKKSFSLLVIALFGLLMFSACSSDDDDNANDTDELVGTWLSQGAGQVAPGLAYFKVSKIVATFNDDQTYTVVSTDSSGTNITYTGTWTAGTQAAGTIRSITLNQSSPTTLTSEGIFQVTGTALKYEVLQTGLTGYTLPSVTGGFGSSAYGGVATPIWIQNYVKQ